MQVCKYFLTDSCRYGDRCRFAHDIYGFETNNPYQYLGQTNQRNVYQKINVQTPNNDQVAKEYLQQIINEVREVNNCKTWPMTTLGYKSIGNTPGWFDLSPEEVRCAAYDALANGTYNKYLNDIEVAMKRANGARKIYINGGKQALHFVKNMLNNRTSTDFTYVQPMDMLGTSNIESFTFHNTGCPSNNSFSLQSSPAFTQNIFGLQNDPAPGLFSLPIQSSLPKQQSVFHSNIFGGVSQNESMDQTPSMFQQPPVSPSDNFTKNIFGQVAPHQTCSFSASTPQQAPPPYNLSQTNSIFGGVNPQPQQLPIESSCMDTKIYSNVNDLTEIELEQFKAQTFTFRKVPFKPPPRELCLS